MTRKQEKPRHSLHHSGCRGLLSFLYMLFGFCQCKTSNSACLGSACLLQTRVRGIPPTLGWGKQSTWLAASGSLAHLRAQPAPTPGGEPDDHGKAPCRGRVGPVCWFRGRGGGGGSCRGYLDSVGPRVGRRLSGPFKFRERTPPWAPFRAVWGRPIFVLG